MSLTTEEPRYEGAFDVVVCPVCGGDAWTAFPGEGVFCDDCNLKVELRPTTGDPGFVADFNADYCHPSHWKEGPPEEHLIPESEENGRLAYAKFMGGPASYSMAWLCVYAVNWEDVETEWRPAWEREDADNTGPDYWNPFFGVIPSDDERAGSSMDSVKVAVVKDDDEDADEGGEE